MATRRLTNCPTAMRQVTRQFYIAEPQSVRPHYTPRQFYRTILMEMVIRLGDNSLLYATTIKLSVPKL